MKKIFLIFAIIFIVLSCNSKTTEKETKSSKVQIGYSINNLNDTWQTFVLEAAKSYFAKYDNYELVVVDAQEDVIKQQDQVNNLVQQSVKGLIVIPTDTDAMQPITKAASDANIPIVYVNRFPFSDESAMPSGIYFVGSDNAEAGQLEGKFVGEKLNGEGGVLILQGILGLDNSRQRYEGSLNILKEQFPKIDILATDTANWQRDQALSKTENWISTYGDRIKAVIAANDEMALGALQAFSSAGMKDIIVIGIDATPDARKSVKEDGMTATVMQSAVGHGVGAAEIIISILEGKSVGEKIKMVPSVLLTKENIDEE